MPLLPTSGTVAVNKWYTQRADYRGMLDCVLGDGTTAEPVSYSVYGMTNLTFKIDELHAPQMQAMDQPVLRDETAIATLSGIGSLPARTADQALCMPVTLRLDQYTTGDLQAAFMLRNALGEVVSTADAPLATANQRLSSNAAPGETLTAYGLLRLPYGAPPGDYDMLLRVYDWQIAPSGYDMAAADGRSRGKDLLVGRWQVVPGADWQATGRRSTLATEVNLPLGPNLTLLRHDLLTLTPLQVSSGEDVKFNLLWQGTDPLPELWLRAVDNSWQMPITTTVDAHDAITLDWRSLIVPANVPSGRAEISPAGSDSPG